MTRYLIDTNIISEATRPKPSPDVLAWLGNQPDTDLFVAAFTIGELFRGILNLPSGRKRAALEQWFEGPEGPLSLFHGRILPLDTASSRAWAKLMIDGRQTGRPRDPLDTIIAAIAVAHDCTVVTLNDRDFRGVPVNNPVRPRKP